MRLGDCCDVVSGATPRTSVPDYWGGGIPWATPKDLSTLRGQTICTTERTVSEEGLRSCGARLLPPGSVLLSSRAPIGYVAINAVPMATNQGFKSLVPKNGAVVDRFLYWWLEANAKRLQRLGSGATFKELSKAAVERIPIFLPSQEEQMRIADAFDALAAVRNARRGQIAALRELVESVFVEQFGREGEWPVRQVSEYVAEFQGGKSIDPAPEFSQTRHRILKISALSRFQFNASETKPIPDDYLPPEEHFVREGDLLFSRANTSELVGTVAYVDAVPDGLLLPDKLWRFVWRDPAAVDPFFVWALFQTPRVRWEISRRATGTSGSMKNISKAKLFGIRTIFPPADEQREFGRRMSQIQGLIRTQQTSLSEVQSLFVALRRSALGPARTDSVGGAPA